ncbi:Synaptic vesicle glycoprotein 2C [Apis cerana cerana]|uniref:Synaptic vesicle glycoprotein 2C n=1 Tax=Apis cerana cerana TaxID=94128 RepID=A0A2A3E3R1_APICC|nr:Synaptic vesicle glycoprotein 2C [Apis cerana cerana]
MMTNDGSNGKISTISVRTEDTDETADIDKAIMATGFGKFNVLLFLAALPVAWAGIFDTTTTAFMIASAECDLRLTYFRKGVLAAFPFLVIAFLISPLSLNVNVFNKRYTAWQIYLLICSIVPILGLVTASTLPQSPKYLVNIGKTDEALKLLRTMYSMNKKKPANTFPIKALLVWENTPLSRHSLFKANSEKIRLAYYNTKLLFSSPYLRAVTFLNFLQFGSMLGFNTMRLWVPHLFIILNNFDDERWTKDRAPTMREMLDRRMSVPAKDYLNCPDFDSICLTWKINAVIYQNSAIIALSAVTFSFLVGNITTSKFRRKAIMLIAFLISVISSFGMNWAQSPLYMLTFAAAIIVTTRITGNIVTALNIDIIPIPLRILV